LDTLISGGNILLASPMASFFCLEFNAKYKKRASEETLKFMRTMVMILNKRVKNKSF
jgi:hypothetical protein